MIKLEEGVIHSCHNCLNICICTMTLTFDLEGQGYILFPTVD